VTEILMKQAQRNRLCGAHSKLRYSGWKIHISKIVYSRTVGMKIVFTENATRSLLEMQTRPCAATEW